MGRAERTLRTLGCILTATLNSNGSARDVEGITDNQDVAWGAETDNSL